MKLAIMQPYFCPHIGYFQLVDAVDTFIFYDDVQYIKQGYINRNTLKNNVRFTIPVSNASSRKKICEVSINWDNPFFKKFSKTLLQLYGSDRNYKEITSIIDKLFDSQPETISELACNSVKLFSEYLGIKTKFLKSSDIPYQRTNDRAINLINICKSLSCNHYINAIGGRELYDKNFFFNHGVKLNFLQGQVSNSIIDSSMNEEKLKHLSDLQNSYKLI